MGLLDSFLGRSRPRLSRQQSLGARPVRNPKTRWTEKDGLVVIHVPLRESFTGRVGKSVLHAPPERDLLLDTIGSEIWHLCDGDNCTVDLIEYMRKRYQFSPKEALLSVTEYLKQLGTRNLIAIVADSVDLKAGK